MSTPEEQLAALKKARASGTLRVVIANGMDVTYRSDAELANAIAALESEIAGSAKPSYLIFRANKGW
jgi:hypothetical protein